MSEQTPSFPLGAWVVTRRALAACATATLVAAPAQLPAQTGAAPVADAGTAGEPASARDDARVLAQQHLRQIQALRRAELAGRLDAAGERLLERLEEERAAVLATVIEEDYGAERREIAAMRSRLAEISAALAEGRRSRGRTRRGRT